MDNLNTQNHTTVVSLIDLICHQYPHHIALVKGEEELTYQEFNNRANNLCNYLQFSGKLKPNSLVGVCLEPSFEMVIAIYAILKAGAAFVTLDPDLPRQRLSYMIKDAQLTTILTQQKFAFDIQPALSQSGIDGYVCFLDRKEVWEETTLTLKTPIVEAEQLAYVIYTSGSTGIPKGVMISHKGLINLVCYSCSAFGIQHGTRVLQFASISFDAAVWEIFTALCGVATLVLGAREEMLPGQPLANFITKHRIEMLCLPPSVLATLTQFREQLLCVRVIVAGGEACPHSLALVWTNANRRFFNAYGPTEITVCATMYEFKHEFNTVPIGYALPNVELYVLDEEFQPCQDGAKGELYIGGVGVAKGYLGKPEMTSDRFLNNPFGTGKIYKTGDIVYLDSLYPGLLHYAGRTDNQVKVRGFRIELEAIEMILGQHPDVQTVAVQVIKTKPTQSENDGAPMLVAYIVPHPEKFVTSKHLQSFAVEQLPDYMVPARFIFMDKLPLMANRSKVDRKSLPGLEEANNLRASLRENTVKIAAIFDDALQLATGSFLPDSNFFYMGGDSLRIAHVLLAIQQKIGISLPSRLIYEYPTPLDLAKFIEEFKEKNKDTIDDKDVNLLADAQLSPSLDISVWQKSPEIQDNSGLIALITGATGFLGAHLLHELLIKNSYRTIYCLVRTSNKIAAFERLRAAFIQYKLPTEELKRVEVISGDIEKPQLELPTALFERLSEEVNIIYHVAADTNYIKPYSAIKKSNLEGTANIIAFAAHRQHKILHYLSSSAVYGAVTSLLNINEVGEDYDIETSASIISIECGYVRTKWAAERMVQAAREEGLAVSIYRPGFISGHRQTRVANNSDTFHRFINGCIQMGIYPDFPEKYWTPIPVDFVASAIAHISSNQKYVGGNYNLIVPRERELSHVEIFEFINELGYRVEKISPKNWLKQLANISQFNSLYPLVSFWQERVYQNRSTILEVHHQTPKVRIDNTLNAIKNSGIEYPDFDKILLKHYVPNFTANTSNTDKYPSRLGDKAILSIF